MTATDPQNVRLWEALGSTTPAMERLYRLLETLSLMEARAGLLGHLERAAKGEHTFAELLGDLLDEEVRARTDKQLSLRLKLAHLPYRRTLDGFDFGFQPSIEERAIRELRTLRFVHDASNVVFLGPPGVGKTHLAVGLAIAAMEGGFGTYFTTAQDLVSDLGTASREGRLTARLRIYTRPKVLVIDEIGYLPLDEIGATLLFQLVSARYERGSMVLTSNKSYGEWDSVFGDQVLAAAILDRLLHHSTTINIRGKSYRLKDRERVGLPGGIEPRSPGGIEPRSPGGIEPRSEELSPKAR